MTLMANRIAVADDHPLIVKALHDCLAATPGFEVICACADGSALIRALADAEVDIIVTDFAMGQTDRSVDGFNLLRQLIERHPDARIVVISGQMNPGIVARAMNLGVRAFVSKQDELDEVVQACVHVATTDECFYSSTIRTLLNTSGAMKKPVHDLTLRETEVVRLYVQGLQLQEIATRVGRSISTVSSQKSTAMDKLGVKKNTDLIRYAYEHGVI
ncbi:response regulator [Cupriavidus sp. 2KB_3]|uniref:response regulator transcription factor n=1 Tax=Cupriavidus TaxID=106589 RepID=UPI0011EC17B5|nr:response regulator transcription factor [Cupriavidus campinensis]